MLSALRVLTHLILIITNEVVNVIIYLHFTDALSEITQLLSSGSSMEQRPVWLQWATFSHHALLFM